ncbi:MAG: site-specific integrase [Cyanobacteria bacterium J06555_12]
MTDADYPVPPVVLKPLTGGGGHSSSPTAPTDIRWLGIDEFLTAKSFAPNTEKAYRRELRCFLSWCDKSWSQIEIRDLTAYKTYLVESGLKASSRNRALACLKSFLA